MNKYVLSIILLFQFSCYAEEFFSEKIETHIEAFEKLYREQELYSGTITEMLVYGSYYQDTLLKFLYEASDVEEYQQGMRALHDLQLLKRFQRLCEYTNSVFNFFTGEFGYPNPEYIAIEVNGKKVGAFLNTFKKNTPLTAEERELYFSQEYTKFLQDGKVQPFILNQENFHELERERIYNFALLPCGTVRVALEREGEREYHVCNDEDVEELFEYPNHTILAGSPHQPVLTAGSFVVYEIDGKRLIFLSCKSGHFQPSYYSLQYMQQQLADWGEDPSTIVCALDVDLSKVLIKLYVKVKAPLFIEKEDAVRLFQQALHRWEATYSSIDVSLLQSLADGDWTVLTQENGEILTKQREEATFMRSAYHLFSSDHEAPEIFHQFVKHFGKLKDGIKHDVKGHISSEAARLLVLIREYEQQKNEFSYIPADYRSMFYFFEEKMNRLTSLLSNSQVTIDEYHEIKKQSRELGTLFLYLSNDAKGARKGYFIYRTVAEAFFSINEEMAKTHDAYIESLLSDRQDRDEIVYITLSPKFADKLKRCVAHLSFCPLHLSLELDQEIAWWWVNSAKNWYLSHYCYFCHPDYENGGGLAVDLNLKKLLRFILTGKDEGWDRRAAIWQIREVKHDAELARSALIFFDKNHQADPLITEYIDSLEHISKAVMSLDFSSVKKEAEFLLDQCGYSHPAYQLAEWECTDQASFEVVVHEYIDPLSRLSEGQLLSSEEAQALINRLNALLDITELFHQNHDRGKSPNIYAVDYEAVERRVMALKRRLQLTEVVVDEEMVCHAQAVWHLFCITSKV